MEWMSLQIKILNADLRYNEELHALVSIQGNNNFFKRKTTITEDGGPLPLMFTINLRTDLTRSLDIKLRAHRMFMFPKKAIGEVQVSIGELLEIYGDAKDEITRRYRVETPAGEGFFDLEFKFIQLMGAPQMNRGVVAAIAGGVVMGFFKGVASDLYDAIGNCFT